MVKLCSRADNSQNAITSVLLTSMEQLWDWNIGVVAESFLPGPHSKLSVVNEVKDFWRAERK